MTATFSILYLDDEADNLTSFHAVFRRNYEIHIAENANDAWIILEQHSIDLIISDQRMPGQSGVEFLEQVEARFPKVLRMILTGYSDMEMIIDAINRGKIYYYIRKPWRLDEMKIILENARNFVNLSRENRRLEFEKQELLVENLKKEKEQIAGQYEVLKNQINPHFLFNCLNTLTSLIDSNPGDAIVFSTRFSKMYRQLLEYGEYPLIPLDSELALSSNYIYLQKIRFGDLIKLEHSISSTNFQIPPFAIQGLVENAIKHNIITESNPLLISIRMEGKELEISNNLTLKNNNENSTGIGLSNLTKRYRLLTGKEISILRTKERFIVRLPLIDKAI